MTFFVYPKDRYIRGSYDFFRVYILRIGIYEGRMDRYIRGSYDFLSCIYPKDRYIRGSYDFLILRETVRNCCC